MSVIHPVILCGGSGTRVVAELLISSGFNLGSDLNDPRDNLLAVLLWPRSRAARPKPFLALLGGRTLFQRSLDRVGHPDRFAPPLIVAGAAHVAAIEEQAATHQGARLVVEPAARKCAPAIALAAHGLAPEDGMLVCPSDHHIADEAAFLAGV